MDGLLVDSEPVILTAAIQLFKERGVTVDPEDFTPFIGTGENSYIGGVAKKHNHEMDISEAKNRLYEIYLDLVPTELVAFPGAVDLIQTCKDAGLKVAIASSADLVKIEANMKKIGVDMSVFDAVMSADTVVNKKPDPEIFLKAASALGEDPQNCTVVEDAIHGIEAANSANCFSVAVAQTFTNDQLNEADLIVEKIADLTIAALTQA